MALVLAAVTAGFGVAAAGCSIRAAGSVAEPTALELQLLGAYREIDDDLVRASSVRGVTGSGLSGAHALEAAAFEARALQRFNADDVAELKRAGCVAETLRAQLVARPCDLVDTDPLAARRRTRVLRQENSARRALIDWAAHRTGARRRPDGVEELRAAYGRLLREAARPGELVEVTPGEFRPVPP